MQPYYQTFSRDPSNSNVLKNQHFFSRQSNLTQEEINRTEENLIAHPSKSYLAKLTKLNQIEQDYQPAKFSKAVEYKNSRSYLVKNAKSNKYEEIELLQSTERLKYFGMGPYFYVQFMRRICWLIFIMSIFEGIRIYINLRGSGLSGYSISFSTYLIGTTLGNFNSNSISNYDTYLVALIPAFLFLILLLFYLCWKCHFSHEIELAEENNSNIKPEKFCIEVQSLEEQINIKQSDLKTIFQHFGRVYEISLIRRHKNKLQYFEQFQAIQQRIKQIQLELKIDGGNNYEELNYLRATKDKITQRINQKKIVPKTISAYVHFQYENSKVQCLNYFNQHYLFNTCPHKIMRNCCCCCINDLPEKFLLNNKNYIQIKNEQVPAPEDINWESFQITVGSSICRYIFSFIIIAIFLVFSCTIIGICTIYVSTHSKDCSSVTIPSTLADVQAANNSTITTCYCNANLLSSLTDSSIQAYCKTYLTSIYIQEAVQYAIIFASSLTNFLFGLVVDKLIDFTRPTSQSGSLKIKTMVFTIFMIFNTIMLPILLYSDIFGFKTSEYFSFLTLISSDVKNFLSVENLQFYLDYNIIWYRNVSPIFTNYLLFDSLAVWIMFVYSKYSASFTNLQNYQGKILQKHMNKQIVSYQFSPYKQYSSFIMVFFMCIFLSSGIPVLMPLALLNLCSRYVTNRSLIQNSSARVDGLGIVFNQLPHTLMPILLIISCINGCWMLTANSQVYPDILPFNIKLWTLNNFGLLSRELYLPFYLFISLFALSQFIIYHVIIRFCGCLSSCCFQKKITIHPSQTHPFTEHKKKMNILTSYNIKSNDKMRNAVTRMEAYIEK